MLWLSSILIIADLLRIHVICRNCRYLNIEKFLRFQKALSKLFIF
jgi:hypothetical protein